MYGIIKSAKFVSFFLDLFINVVQGFGRTALEQAGFQAMGIASTIVIAAIAGLVTGILLNLPMMRRLKKDEHHDDDVYWNVPEDFKQI